MEIFESVKNGAVIGRYLTGKESDDDRRQLKEWLSRDIAHQKLFQEIKKEKNISQFVESYDSFNKDKAWLKYIGTVLLSSYRKAIIRWKIAAVFFFLLGCAGIIAYMTVTVSRESFTTISTNKGQNSKLTLPDGSVVWLSSGTTLTYNTNFGERERLVKLSGQAFFEIAKNKEKPLMVVCNALRIKVLGTSFDVSAYPDDQNIDVVLESGSVELTLADNESFKQMLSPGEMARFDTEYKRLIINRETNYKFTSWKDGVLIFRNDPMYEVLKKLERRYNIDIQVNSADIYQLVFNATIINENVDEIFHLIKFSCGIDYNIIPSDNPKIPVKVVLTK